MVKLKRSRMATKYALLLIALLITVNNIAADISRDPVYIEALAKLKQNDLEEAHRLFKRLQEDYPDNPTVLNDFAAVAAQLGQLEFAIRLLEHAMMSHPTLSISYKNLQSLYNYKAAQEYKKALALDAMEVAVPQLNVVGIPTQTADPVVASELVLAQEVIDQPLVEEAEPSPSEDDQAQIADHLKRWAEAWSRQDLTAYFDSYIKDYRPRSGSAHLRWRKLRESRIVNPQFINIRISDLSIKKQDDNNALLTFRQHYQSNLLKSTVVKELEFYKTEAGWRIKSERVVTPS